MAQRCIKCRKARKTKKSLCAGCRVEYLNAGSGRRLTPEESAEKTKGWPKSDGKSMAEANTKAQEAGYGYSNLPPGVTQHEIDNHLT